MGAFLRAAGHEGEERVLQLGVLEGVALPEPVEAPADDPVEESFDGALLDDSEDELDEVDGPEVDSEAEDVPDEEEADDRLSVL